MRQSYSKPGVFYQSCRRTCGGGFLFIFYFLFSIFYFLFFSILLIRAIILDKYWVFPGKRFPSPTLQRGPRGVEAGGWFHEKRCYDFDAALFYLIFLFFNFFMERGGRNREERKRGSFTDFPVQYVSPPKTHLLHFTSLPPPPLFLFSYVR